MEQCRKEYADAESKSNALIDQLRDCIQQIKGNDTIQ